METFLDTLNPSVREQVDRALELEGGEARLRRVVGPYIDDEGEWPNDDRTNDFLARSYLRQSEFAMPGFGSSGLSNVAIGALAGGALSLAAGQGLIVSSSAVVERYWAEMIGYAYGINPSTLRKIKNVIDFFSDNTDWRNISRQMKSGFKSVKWAEDFSDRYANKLSGVFLGEMANVAWRGARSAANHLIEPRVEDVSQHEWIGDYVAKFARNQADLSKRTARRIVEDALEHGLSENVLAGRLQQMWALTPHHVDASNRYRRNLQQQDRTAAWVDRMSRRYNDRLLNTRLKAITETESLTLFNLGREAQWMRSVKTGVLPSDTMKMWVTGRDEKVCEVCAPMDGEIAPLGEVFPEVGLYVPAAHPNCRCITIPVQRGIATMDEAQLVFPVRDVSKHLGGPSGTDDHPSGTPQSVHSVGREMYELGQVLNDMETGTFFSRKKMAAVLGSESAADELFDEIVAFTSNMNSVKELRGSSKRLGDLVRTAPRVEKTLHRGEAWDPKEVDDALKKGAVIRRELSSFTDNPDILRVFDGKRLGRDGPSVHVRMHLSPGARAVHVEPVANSNNRRARGLGEHLVSGDFEVVSVRRDGNTMDLEIRSADAVSKRVITIPEYTRGDGTIVEQHERKLSTPAKVDEGRLKSFLDQFERDGELSTEEQFALGTAGALGLAILSRGRIRRAATPSIYKDVRRTKNGYVVSDKLKASLRETFEFNGSRYAARIDKITVGDTPHHAMSFEAVAETLEAGNRVQRAASRLFRRRNNIRVEGSIIIPDEIAPVKVGSFDVAIDPRRREAFQYGMHLSKGTQGKGFAGEFTTHLGVRYMETGIERVGALASGSVGGYAWAARGFDWRYGPSPIVIHSLNQAAKGKMSSIGGAPPPAVAKEIADIQRRIKTGFLTGRFPKPQEVANIGRDYAVVDSSGRSMWYGKKIMMDSQWHASLDLRQIRKLLRTEGVVKRTITIEEYTRSDGTVVERHERKLDDSKSKAGLAVGAGAVALGAGAIATRGKLKGIKQFPQSPQWINNLADGAYDMPISELQGLARGSGIRIGQNNRTRSLANSILERGFTKPITVRIYDNGPFIQDGMHRLEAANMLGMKNIPVTVKRVAGNRPDRDLRGYLAGRRIQRQTPDAPRDTPFRNVREEQGFIRWFNERRSMKGEAAAASTVGKMADVPVRYDLEEVRKRTVTVRQHTRSDGTVVEEHERKIGDKKEDWLIGSAAVLALTAGGILAFRRVPPWARHSPQPLGPKKSMNTGELADLEAMFRKGSDNVFNSWAGTAAENFKRYNDSFRFRLDFMGNKLGPRDMLFSDLVANSASANRTLYRGMEGFHPGVRESFDVGKKIYMGPSSFSSSYNVARKFAGKKNSVVLHVQKDARALPIDRSRARGDTFRNEREWLASGEFEVYSTRMRGDTKHVFLRQTGVIRPGDVPAEDFLRGVAKHLGGPSGELPHEGTGTRQEVHGSNVQAPDPKTTARGGRAGGLNTGPKRRQDSSRPGDQRFFREGEWDAGNTAALGATGLVGTAALMVTRGKVRNMQQLTLRMRRLNEVASRPLRNAQTGDIRMVDTRRMDVMTEGTGFRLGNQNHIRQIANNMMKHGYDQSQPVIMAVYRDGSQVLDGMHRAQAARAAGIKSVPVKVIRVDRNMPTAQGFRGQYDSWRKAAARHDNLRTAQPKPTGPYSTRDLRWWERKVNAHFERGGVSSTEDFIRRNATMAKRLLAALSMSSQRDGEAELVG